MWRQWRYREVAENAKDSVSSLQELQDKSVVVDLPTNAVINQGDHLLFASIEYTNKPEINYCLCDKEDVEYKLCVRGNKIKKKNIMTDDIPSLLPQLMSIEILEQSDCCTDNKNSTIKQLSLSASKPTARIYSPSLLAFSMTTQKNISSYICSASS